MGYIRMGYIRKDILIPKISLQILLQFPKSSISEKINACLSAFASLDLFTIARTCVFLPARLGTIFETRSFNILDS